MTILNSPFESGIRALFILVQAFPDGLDIDRLTLMDHALMNGADLGIGQSLSPTVPIRASGLSVRRANMQEATELFRRAELVELVAGDGNRKYRATDSAAPFIRLLTSRHAEDLREQVQIVWSSLGQLDDERLAASFGTLIQTEVAGLRYEEGQK